MQIRCDVEQAREYGRKLKAVYDRLNEHATADLERALQGQPRDARQNDTGYTDSIFALFDVGKALQQVVNALDTQHADKSALLSQPVVDQLMIYGIIPPRQV